MFDPYHKWLGILPKDQPPNYYRLLSLELFESDLEVIEGAADRQMSFVRQYQSGEYAADAAKILNELALARLCLLKPTTKAAYDEKLRKERVAAEPALAPENAFADLSISDTELTPRRAPPKRQKKLGKSKTAGPSPQLMIGGGIAACVLLVVFLFSGNKSRTVEKLPEPTQVASSASNPVPVPTARPADPAKPDTITKPATPSVPTVTPEATRSTSPADPALWSEPELVTESAGEAIDLLKSFDLTRDLYAGEWQQTPAALSAARRSSLYLPVKSPEDYQIKLAARQIEGADTLSVGFMMAGRQGVMSFDAYEATLSGLYVDACDPDNNCTTRRGKLFKDRSTSHIVLTVHPGHLHVAFDGRTIVDWHGNPERLFLHSGHVMPSRESPFLMVGNAKYSFESASLIPIKPELARSRLARLDREVDVLPLIDLDRDVQSGIWSLSNGTLSSPDGWGKIYLPTIVPEEYTLSATVELPAQHRAEFGLGFGLIAGNSYFAFQTAHADCGLDAIDGRRFYENETRLAPLLEPGVPARIDCTVTKVGIRVEVAGKSVVNWRGGIQRLSLPGDWALPDGRRLFLGVMRHVKFRDIKLGPPISSPTVPQYPPLSVGKPFDLLAMIDLARDVISGTWERNGASIRCRGDVDENKLVIPFEVPDEYKLTMRVTRLTGGRHNTEAVYLGLPIGNSKADVVIDGLGSTFSGIHLDHKPFNENVTSYRGGPIIQAGPPREFVFTVRQTGIRVTSNGVNIIDWRGNPERFTFHGSRLVPGHRLSLGSWNQSFRFEKLELDPLPPTSFPAVAPLGADGKLLPIINVERDSRKGDWKLAADALLTPKFPGARLRIPVIPPDNYIFSASVERRQQGGQDIFFGLNVGGHSCAVSIDGGDNGHEAGLERLDDLRFVDPLNLTHRNYGSPLLPLGKRIRVRCYVMPDTVVVTCGDKVVVRWHGDPRRLSLEPTYLPPNDPQADRDQLWLGCFGTAFLVRDLELKPMTDGLARRLSQSFSGVYPVMPQLQQPLSKFDLGTE